MKIQRLSLMRISMLATLVVDLKATLKKSELDASMAVSTKRFQSLSKNHATMINQFLSQFIERSKFHMKLSEKKKSTSPNTSTFTSQYKFPSKCPSTLRSPATEKLQKCAPDTKLSTKIAQELSTGREKKSVMFQKLSMSKYHVCSKDVLRSQCHTRS